MGPLASSTGMSGIHDLGGEVQEVRERGLCLANRDLVVGAEANRLLSTDLNSGSRSLNITLFEERDVATFVRIKDQSVSFYPGADR